ncbi:MAG: hypothetical protein IPM94_02050 [bacterium]|nr:hypothetical protein [bacterium]
MPTPVALVATRPETLPRDVARVLALAGRDEAEGCRSITAARAVGPHPAGGVPNWTLAALAAACPPSAGRPLLAVAGALHPGLGACGCLAALAGLGGAELAAAARAPRALLERLAPPDDDDGPWLLVDLTVAAAPDGRTVMYNRVLAGRDPLALDALTARCLGWDPESMPLLRAAREAGGRREPADRTPAGDADDHVRAGAPLRPWRPARDLPWSRFVPKPRRSHAGAVRTPWHALGDDIAAGREPVWEVGADV